jgi:hypothetical protein
MTNAPIVVFTYNRPAHTRVTIEALQKNTGAAESDLFIISDAAENNNSLLAVQEVRDYLKTVSGFKKKYIIERDKNYGLGNNIITGVTDIIEEYGRVIVLEDDLITSPFFLQYMNGALDIYAENEKVICIHGYTYPVKENLPDTFFLKGADCWGWGTWKRAWKLFERNGEVLLDQLIKTGQTSSFDFNDAYHYTAMLKDQIAGKNTSWAVRWYASAFLMNMYTLYPGKSLVFHDGGDGSGTNAGHENLLDVELSDKPVKLEEINVEQNILAFRAFSNFLRTLSNPTLLYRVKRKWKKLISQKKKFRAITIPVNKSSQNSHDIY